MSIKWLAAALLLAAAQLQAQSDSLRIYYVGKPVGWERYSFEILPDKSIRYEADLDYIDRGRRTRLGASGRFDADYSPRFLDVARVVDTTLTTLTKITVTAGRATVERLGKISEVDLPKDAFAFSPYTPVSQHLALLARWRALGSPATMSIVPAEPVNRVAIRYQGVDSVTVGGGPQLSPVIPKLPGIPAKRVALTRHSIDGVVWGLEYAWLGDDGRLAMFASAAGGLSFKAVRADLVDSYDELMEIAARAAVADLAAITARTKPIAEGVEKPLALVGATVIDGTGRAAIPDATVIVEKGRIVAVGPRASVPIPRGARQMDVRGKTIIPGLWDSHAHLHQLEWPAVYLAAGVTTVRDMGNEFAFANALKAAAKPGLLPNLIFAGIVDGPGPNAFGGVSAGAAEEGRAIVRRYHVAGFAQIKLYDLLARDVVVAIADEAHKFGMIVTGHIPRSLGGVRGGVNAGMDQVAHLSGTFASDSGAAIIEFIKSKGFVVDPTVSWNEIGGHSTAEPLESFQPGARRLPPVFMQTRAAGWGQAVDTAVAHARLAASLRSVAALYKAGVPVVAGTDEGVPGFSVYREMELYVQAGMTPMDALRAATSVPAKAMRMDADVGTVEVGRRADLLVLDADPLADISNVRRLRLVMKDGRVWESGALWRGVGFGSE